MQDQEGRQPPVRQLVDPAQRAQQGQREQGQPHGSFPPQDVGRQSPAVGVPCGEGQRVGCCFQGLEILPKAAVLVRCCPSSWTMLHKHAVGNHSAQTPSQAMPGRSVHWPMLDQ